MIDDPAARLRQWLDRDAEPHQMHATEIAALFLGILEAQGRQIAEIHECLLGHRSSETRRDAP